TSWSWGEHRLRAGTHESIMPSIYSTELVLLEFHSAPGKRGCEARLMSGRISGTLHRSKTDEKWGTHESAYSATFPCRPARGQRACAHSSSPACWGPAPWRPPERRPVL